MMWSFDIDVQELIEITAKYASNQFKKCPYKKYNNIFYQLIIYNINNIY